MGNPRKITVDYGMKDYYKFYRQQGGTADRITFSKVFTNYLYEAKEELLVNKKFKFPHALGALSIKKYKPKLKLDNDGNLINKFPVNIKATNDLWKSDEEAKEKRILVRHMNRHTDGYTFTIQWNKGSFKHCGYYQFSKYRTLKRELAKRIINGKYDAFIL